VIVLYSFVVLCDDLTGSSDQSILLKERGLSVEQIARLDGENLPEGNADALVINCDSRRRTVKEVNRIFDSIFSMCTGNIRFTKRIDTTLRGHLLLETSKILERDQDQRAFVVPAFPASGRTTIGSYQLLNGELLERTEVRWDSNWPISTSYIPAYFEGSYETGLITSQDLQLGIKELAEKISRMAENSKIIIADSLRDSDIELLARAASETKINFVPVDPSPFTAAYIHHQINYYQKKPVVAVIGSTALKIRKQVDFLSNQLKTYRIDIDPYGNMIIPKEEFRTSFHEVLLITSSEKVIPGKEDVIADKLAITAQKWIADRENQFSGIILSGGDTAVRFFEVSNISMLSSEEEILPLMIGTTVTKGPLKGTRIVTKGGLVGDDDALYKAFTWLSKQRRKV
jgi:uncharacterized protein YgbK (DUF1537 family)